MRILSFLSVLPLIIMAACTSNNKSITEDTSGTSTIARAIKANKSVVMVDVRFDGKPCSQGTVNFGTLDDYLGHTIVGYPANNFLRAINRHNTITKPEKYYVKRVKCDGFVLKVSSLFGLPTESYKQTVKSISPQFTVSAGQILHIGTINVVTLKKAGLLSDAKGIAVRQQTTESSRKNIRQRFPSLHSKIHFTN